MRILSLAFCLLLGIPSFTRIMSNPDVDDESSTNDPGSDLDDDAAATQTAGDEQLSNPLAKHRSANFQASISKWPVPRILENLFSHNIAVSTGVSHQDLFTFFLASSDPDPTPPSSSNPAPAKAKDKRKNTTPAAASTASAKRSSYTPQDVQDPVLAALFDIKDSINKMDARVAVLEKPSLLSVESPGISQCDVSQHHTLATATPAPSSGTPFISSAAAIPASLRNQILAGNDINLVKILLCSSGVIDKRIVDCGDISVVLKECDPRLSKSLSLVEFYFAFGVLRDTICEVYPNRRSELDTYSAIISSKASRRLIQGRKINVYL